MPADGREYTARDLTARWLTVEEVLGRRPVRGLAMSAGEYPASPAGAGVGAAAGAGAARAGAALGDSAGANPAGAGSAPDDPALAGAASVGAALADRASAGAALAGRASAGAAPGDSRRADLASRRAVWADTTPAHREPFGRRSAAEPKLPPPDLVAADTDFAARWFTADPTPGRLAGRTVVLPFVAVAELATWPERLLWSHPRSEELSVWTDPRRMILGDDTVCRIWARITVAAQRAGRSTPAHDSWVAAGCLSYGLPLATLNKQRYRYFAERYGLRLL